MAEARPEDDEENVRESREQVVRRPASGSGGRPDRRKPEHRLSQGPLSSIRAAIKRTSNRSTSLSETPPRERERERERERDRRRPEITILSAEPISSWFPGAGFPPPPPPAAQIWGPSLVPSVLDLQPPPSYEDVIREKNQEQGLAPPPAAPLPLSVSSCPQSIYTTTIATQTDTGNSHDAQSDTQVRRPLRPPKPSVPSSTSKPSKPDDSLDESFSPNCTSAPSISTQTPSDLLSSPLTSSGAETNQSEVVLLRPRPRPRSKINLQPVRDEVKVQTLVKLREDGLKTLAARSRTEAQTSNQESIGGKYLQELLEAFSSDDWGFPEQRSPSQSESEDESNQEVTGQEEEEDMATLRARIQAFEQMHDGNFEEARIDPCETPKQRPEPKPRPRLPQSKPPIILPKPKNVPNSGDVLNSKDGKGLWEDGGQSLDKSEQRETSEKELLAPKTEVNADTNATANATPVALPRPSPPPSQPKLPPRPSIAPRAKPGGASQSQERGSNVGPTTPPLPPRPAMDMRTRANKMETVNGEENTGKTTAKVGSPRPDVPAKPTAVFSRRSSAPNLVSNPAQAPDPAPVPGRPSGPPRPALRKSTSIQNNAEPSQPPRPTGGKLLPLRPPPMKSFPGRPPPPSVNTSSAPPPCLTKSPSSPSLQSDAAVLTNHALTTSTNQAQGQRASKKGPPLPPRPKPGHPLYHSYTKQEMLIVVDDPNPASSEPNSQSGDVSAPVADSTVCLLDLDLEPVQNQDQNQDQHQDHNQTKPGLEGLSQTKSILPLESDQKKEPEPAAMSGPRCVALFDFSAVEEDELSFSRGDVIALLDVIGGDRDWGRGQLHGRIGIFPMNFTETVEPLPTAPSTGESGKTTAAQTTNADKTGPAASLKEPVAEEWAVALFDFPGQTADDLCFHKGALIRVLEHIDPEWRRGRVEDREGLYPAAFTQPATKVQPIRAQRPESKAKALFDFSPENDDELSLKAGDILTQVEPVDEEWIVGVVGSKRGIVPKNYISLLT